MNLNTNATLDVDLDEMARGGAVFWKISLRWSVEAILTTPVAGTDDLGAWDGYGAPPVSITVGP